MSGSGAQALALLQNIEARSRQKALGLPQQLEVKKAHAGIGFRLREMSFVVPTDEVVEILSYPSLTRIPGTVKWVKGLANIRGMLIPIVDLFAFVSDEITDLNRQSRVLVMRKGDLISGLLVSEVLGLRHFLDEEESNQLPDVPERLKILLRGAYEQGGVHWGVFDTRRLVETPAFMEVAGQ
ncbi:MAG: chemotaxis protein CheW [Gammaproteobacteria bacterium]|nr:chemotaxis protein CheW [Gammaproteobacteria bacterium]